MRSVLAVAILVAFFTVLVEGTRFVANGTTVSWNAFTRIGLLAGTVHARRIAVSKAIVIHLCVSFAADVMKFRLEVGLIAHCIFIADFHPVAAKAF